jgi:DNA polymerase-3 subunit chi
MADIRFYTLSASGGATRLRHACTLTEQAYLAGERVLVWLDDAAQLSQFDQLLWTFNDRAFVPHEPLAADPASGEAPVQLHHGATLDSSVAASGFTTLVNLHDAPSAEVLRFPRVIEVIDGDARCRDAGRVRFRFYREAGATPQHVEVSAHD